MRFRLLLITALLLVLGCSSPTSVSDGVFTVRREAGALTLINGATFPLFYFAVERDAAASIRWFPCVADPCRSVDGQSSRRIPDAEIIGFQAGAAEAIVYYWRTVPDREGRMKAGDIRLFVIEL